MKKAKKWILKKYDREKDNYFGVYFGQYCFIAVKGKKDAEKFFTGFNLKVDR